MNLTELHRRPAAFKKFLNKTKNHKMVDNREVAWVGTLDQLMAEFGFKPLGTGKYGAVYGKKTYPVVIKVFQRDVAYLKWMSFVLKNQGNKWVPKIRGKVVKIGPIFMAVRMEKLDLYTSGTNPEDVLDAAIARGDKDAKVVLDFIYDNEKLMDMHSGNVMMRGNQMVVTDPLYNWRKQGRFTLDPDNIEDLKDVF